jgi:hypothetical protein
MKRLLGVQGLIQDWHAGERIVGDQLNLERAMGPHVRFGGHFVQVSRRFHSPADAHCHLWVGSCRRHCHANLDYTRR